MVKMPFEKKPESNPIDVEALINKGAPLKGELDDHLKNWKNINLRIPTEMLKSIDLAVSKSVGISRTGWILQAIHKELKSYDS